MTLADLQANAKEHGFEHHFMCEDDGARSDGTGQLPRRSARSPFD